MSRALYPPPSPPPRCRRRTGESDFAVVGLQDVAGHVLQPGYPDRIGWVFLGGSPGLLGAKAMPSIAPCLG
eukprot:2528503-Pyramimonas_sp.AAC.1